MASNKIRPAEIPEKNEINISLARNYEILLLPYTVQCNTSLVPPIYRVVITNQKITKIFKRPHEATGQRLLKKYQCQNGFPLFVSCRHNLPSRTFHYLEHFKPTGLKIQFFSRSSSYLKNNKDTKITTPFF